MSQSLCLYGLGSSGVMHWAGWKSLLSCSHRAYLIAVITTLKEEVIDIECIKNKKEPG